MRLLMTLIALLSTLAGPLVPADEPAGPSLWYGGDSISNAYDCPGCRVLGRVFAARVGLRVLPSSLGLNGHTFAQFGAAVRRIPRASVIVVELGTNDFLQGLEPAHVARAAGQLLDRIRAVNPAGAASLFCTGVSSLPHAVNGRGLTPLAYDRVIAAECVRREGVFLPITQALADTPGTFLRDEVHISQRGHDLIAALLAEALQTVD
jgi:lysophospholipase L1-like esterase